MRLLLDENLPRRLKSDFADHEIYTVRDKGWNGMKNGKLLQLMEENGFQALLTFDKNLQYQQNFQKYTITVFVLSAVNNTYLEMTALSPKVHEYLNQDTLLVPFVLRNNKPAPSFRAWQYLHTCFLTSIKSERASCCLALW